MWNSNKSQSTHTPTLAWHWSKEANKDVSNSLLHTVKQKAIENHRSHRVHLKKKKMRTTKECLVRKLVYLRDSQESVINSFIEVYVYVLICLNIVLLTYVFKNTYRDACWLHQQTFFPLMRTYPSFCLTTSITYTQRVEERDVFKGLSVSVYRVESQISLSTS